MTYRERIAIQHPECVDQRFAGGVNGCPGNYWEGEILAKFHECGGYKRMTKKDFSGIHDECRACWDREAPPRKVKVRKKMEWKKTARKVTQEGTFIRYAADGCDVEVESRKREIPHANGSGSWTFTSYFVIDPATGKEKEFHRFAKAKEVAETLGRIHNG